MSSYQQLCQDVTDSVITALKAGDVGEWSAPWHHAANLWAPRNALTSKLYATGDTGIFNKPESPVNRLGRPLKS